MKITSFLLLLVSATVSLMAIALYNGFPLVESDSGVYIEQAIYPHFTADRTPFYGLFLRITSLWTSLWFPIAVQSLILAGLLIKYVRHFLVSKPAPTGNEKGTGSSPDFSFTLLTLFVIISFTCVSWVTSYLMPDIFAGILLLAIILYLSEQRISLGVAGLYLSIIFLAGLMHNSNFFILLLFSLLVMVWFRVKKVKIKTQRSAALVAVSVAVWVVMCSMNAIKKHGFVFSRGKDVIVLAKLAESGILGKYIDENCNNKNYKMCAYKNNIPATFSDFLWSGESPLYKMGGWDSNRTEYKNIVHDIFTTPRYGNMFAEKTVISTLKELVQVQAPDLISWQGQDTEPWKKVRQYFADELREYNTSMQNAHALSAAACNLVYYLFFILSTIWVLLLYSRVMTPELSFVYCCILIFFVINAFVTSVFSPVIFSFQNRIFWILPATNAIVMVKYYRSRYLNTPQQINKKSGPDLSR
jgi:hypothetical protein